MSMRLRIYKILLFKSRRHLCKGSIVFVLKMIQYTYIGYIDTLYKADGVNAILLAEGWGTPI